MVIIIVYKVLIARAGEFNACSAVAFLLSSIESARISPCEVKNASYKNFLNGEEQSKSCKSLSEKLFYEGAQDYENLGAYSGKL